MSSGEGILDIYLLATLVHINRIKKSIDNVSIKRKKILRSPSNFRKISFVNIFGIVSVVTKWIQFKVSYFKFSS